MSKCGRLEQKEKAMTMARKATVIGAGSTAMDWKKLTLRQRIGQTMLMLPDGPLEQKLGGGSLSAFFESYPVTGFFMGWKLFDGVADDQRIARIRSAVVAYQAASTLPLLFQEDYETGVSLPGMTPFPHEMALGATHSPELAYAYGRSLAWEARSVGVRWVLHPVADLNSNPLNPVTNVRSISDDPDTAIQLLARQIAGLQENGVAATIKHFPGDGVDRRDQHLTTTCNSLTLEHWRSRHGRVFQELINGGVAAIMPGHITLPAYQKERINGFPPPATLSRELLTDLLKGEMGFKGVIVSDAMTMGGFRGWYPNRLEGEIQSFLAGVDVLLWPSYEFMDEVERRIQRGEIPLQRLDDAVSRVWALKQRLGLMAGGEPLIRPLAATEKESAILTARAIAEKALTLVRDRNQALPLRGGRDRKILLVGVVPVSRKGGEGGFQGLEHLRQRLAKRGFDVTLCRNILYETQGWESDAPEVYDRIIAVVIKTPHNPFGPLQLWDDEAQTAWGINAMPKEKIIVVSMGSPYVLNEYFERVDTCINAYSSDVHTQDALVQALLGEIPFGGESPVSLGWVDPM
jgi:beta-N-acetylhexosaminidase